MSNSALDHLDKIYAISDHLSSSALTAEDVEVLLSFLRPLRAVFTQALQIDQDQCTGVLTTLTPLITRLLTPESRRLFDETAGRDHLALSVSIQCLVN